jgi:hypothetical protein
MIIKTISATYNRKFNLGRYNSSEMGVTMWADLEPEENPIQAITELMGNCREEVRKEATALVFTIKQGRRPDPKDAIEPILAVNHLSEFQPIKDKEPLDTDELEAGIDPSDGLPFGDK